MELSENHKIKIEKFENTIIGHLTINSLKSKFILAQTFSRDCNIFLISVMREPKTNNNFPNKKLILDLTKIDMEELNSLYQ